MDQTLRDKYTGSHQSGLEKLATRGFELWKGVPANDQPKPFVAAVIVISDRIDALIKRIAASAEQYGVQIFLAERDFPFHVTLSQGKVDKGNFTKMSECADQLAGNAWTFEHFVLSGRDCIVGSEDGPAIVSPVRAAINDVMNMDGLEAGSPPILHSTIFRIMAYPSLEALKAFVDDMCVIRLQLVDSPLELLVGSVYWGPVGPFLNHE